MTSDPNPLPNTSASATIALAAALLVAAGGGGFLAYRLWAGHASTLTPIQYPGSVRSKPAAGESDESAPPSTKRIPAQLPDISMPDAKGVPHKLSEWKGRPLMVNFWATWCDPCRREIPLLKSLRRERAGESLEIVGIAVDFQDSVQDYTHRIGIDYPVLIGEKDGMAAIDAFGMDTVFPFTVFADKAGRIFTVKVGELGRDEANLILDGLREVDEGKVDIAAARQRIADAIAKLDAAHSRQRAAGQPGNLPRS
jgi:thiol-disulfide isomerase/thioredoxin